VTATRFTHALWLALCLAGALMLVRGAEAMPAWAMVLSGEHPGTALAGARSQGEAIRVARFAPHQIVEARRFGKPASSPPEATKLVAIVHHDHAIADAGRPRGADDIHDGAPVRRALSSNHPRAPPAAGIV
jgi:hypothetical protein